jgi:hypothetical protein
MSEQSKRSQRRRRRRYIHDDEEEEEEEDDETKVTKIRRRYICDDEEEEDDETKVSIPPPSSAGEASTARNSTPRPPAASQEKGSCNLSPPPATPAKRKVSIARMRTMEDIYKLDSHPRNEEQALPPCSEKTSLAVKSLHSWSKRAARSLSQAKRRGGENKRKAVTPLQSYASTEAPSNRPPKKKISISINEKKMEDKVHENPRNEANDESFIQRVLRDVDTQIGLLNGIINYYARNGRYPFHDFKALDDFIDNWLQVVVLEEEQLIDVVRKLRKEYLKKMARMGASANFEDRRDQIAFNLANQLWGAGRHEEYWKRDMGMKLKWYNFYFMN